ncbi:MAG: TlpA disulfide reductase family protein [Thermoanaerobaculia bacterium]
MKMTSFASRRRAMAVLIASLALLALSPAASRAEDVSLSCLDGGRLGDADLARGTTIAVVWASWSPHSRDIVARVSSLASRWGGRARVVTVDYQEDRPAVERFLAGRSLGAPVCMDADGAFSRKYNVAKLPGLVVFKDGSVVHRGKLPDDADQVLADLLH